MSTVPLRRLLVLTVVVVAAHLLLLGVSPQRVHAPESVHSQAFVTRTVAIDPAPALASEAAPPVPAPKPPPARKLAVPAAPAPGVADVVAVAAAASAVEAPAARQPASSAPQHEAAASPAVAVAIPGSMRLQYKVGAQVRGLTMHAAGELLWRHDADSYEASLRVSAPLLPTRTQRSTGRITAEGLAPLRFSDKGRSEEAAHFERDKGKVSFSNNRPDVPLQAGAQDRLSILLQLSAMIAGDPAKFPPATTIAIQTVGIRDAEPWVFTVEGAEQLDLPGGKLRALKLTRVPRMEFDLKVELWLAPGMDYIPVRLRLTQPNGDWVDQQWSSTDKG